MKVYCAHAGAKQPVNHQHYVTCSQCGFGWYVNDPAPLVVVGVTSPTEVERYPFLRKFREDKENEDL